MSGNGPLGNYNGILKEHLIGHVLRETKWRVYIPLSNKLEEQKNKYNLIEKSKVVLKKNKNTKKKGKEEY